MEPSFDTVRLLLAAGADKWRVDMHGRTARLFAKRYGDADKVAEIVALLDAEP
jgi:ankyrin repeat protein